MSELIKQELDSLCKVKALLDDLNKKRWGAIDKRIVAVDITDDETTVVFLDKDNKAVMWMPAEDYYDIVKHNNKDTQ